MKEFYDTGLNTLFYEIESLDDLNKIKDQYSDVFITVINTGNFNKYSETIKVLDRMISGHYPGTSIICMTKNIIEVMIYKDEFSKIIKESVNRILTEANNKRELANQVAREILGTDSFEEFYKKTGFMVGSRDYYLMSEYFKKLAELEQQANNNG